MPDLDIIERGLSPGWRKPYRLLAGEQPAPHVAKALLQAVALSLRRNGGVPGLIEIAETLARFNAGSLVVQELFGRLRFVEESHGRHRHTRVAARAAQRLAAGAQAGQVLLAAPLPTLATHFCHELVDHQLFGRAD